MFGFSCSVFKQAVSSLKRVARSVQNGLGCANVYLGAPGGIIHRRSPCVNDYSLGWGPRRNGYPTNSSGGTYVPGPGRCTRPGLLSRRIYGFAPAGSDVDKLNFGFAIGISGRIEYFLKPDARFI